MEIKLHLLQESDAEELLAFEQRNRLFFEKHVPGRGEDYYQQDTFRRRHRELMKEQEEGHSYFYLVKTGDGQIVGRVNLVDVDPLHHEAEVGFRIGADACGQGIAGRALRQLLEAELPVTRIRGKTTMDNTASRSVLEKMASGSPVSERNLR